MKEALVHLIARAQLVVSELEHIGNLMSGVAAETPDKRRERIATACLTGLLAADANPEPHHTPACRDPEGAARVAVECADALIAALKESPEVVRERVAAREAARAARDAGGEG